jgi:plasmid stabilization system protein ParE
MILLLPMPGMKKSNQKKLGDRFLRNIDSALKVISKNPEAFSFVNVNHRHYPLKKFPFVILYEVDNGTIFIDAVFHTSRNPENK